MKKVAVIAIILLSTPGIILAVQLFTSAAPKPDPSLEPVHRVETFSPIKNSDLMQRVYPIPDFVLKHLREFDERDDYTGINPDERMRGIIKGGLDILPPLTRAILKERLLGIFFIRNFLGYGMTEWAVDSQGRLFSFIVINPDVFNGDISQILTKKEKTCFIPDADYDIQCDCGHDLNGFVYIILHETVHAVDYALGLTPYTEETIKNYRKGSCLLPLMNSSWKSYSVLARPFPYRDRVTFYGFSGGPKLPIAEAPDAYRALRNTPLISIYGTLNWAEDMAEFLTFHHLARRMKHPVTIRVLKKGTEIYRYEPMKVPRVKIREGELDLFYKPPDRFTGHVPSIVPGKN